MAADDNASFLTWLAVRQRVSASTQSGLLVGNFKRRQR